MHSPQSLPPKAKLALLNFAAKGRLTLAIVGLACILIRIAGIYLLQSSRDVPIEIDDTLSYVMHASVIEHDPAYRSPTLRSFTDLKLKVPQRTLEDFDTNRVYHRVQEFYHLGHAWYTFLLKWVTGGDYLTIHWYLTYFLNILMIIAAAMLLGQITSVRLAAIALVFFSPVYLVNPHHWMAVPREFSALGFILSLMFVEFAYRLDLSQWRRRILWGSAIFASLFVCLSSHKIGLLFAAQLLAIEVGRFFLTREPGRADRLRLFCFPLALAALSTFALGVVLGVPDRDGLPVLVDFHGGIDQALSVFLKTTYRDLVTLSPFVFLGDSTFSRFGGGILLLMAVFGTVHLWKDKRKATLTLGLLLGTSLAGEFGLCLLGIDYRPVIDVFRIHPYNDTIYYLSLSGLLAVGAYELAAKLHRVWRSAAPPFLSPAASVIGAMGLVALLVPGLVRTSSQLEARVSALNVENGKRYVELLNSLPDSSCVVVEDEVPLYFLLTYGDFTREVSYNHLCRSPNRYRNQVAPAGCRYVFAYRKKLEQCGPPGSFRRIAEGRDFVLAEIEGTEGPTEADTR